MEENEYNQKREQFLERILRSARGTFEIFTIYIGNKLGYYQLLSKNGRTSARELALQSGTAERYAKEWLEQQSSVGILEVDNPTGSEKKRRFRLPLAHAEVLAQPESLNYLAPLAQLVVGAVRPSSRVVDAFRSGKGVQYGEYGADLREGQAGMNRAMFLKLLGTEWLPSIPDLHERLSGDPPARVADIGCGLGWSSIGIAKAYPKIIVEGFDMDLPSVEAAAKNAEQFGLSDRVHFFARDAGEKHLMGRYDLVTAFECLHDMSDPVGVLKNMLGMAGESGSVIVMDERVGDRFGPDASEVEQMLYGFSVLHCLPSGMAEQPSAATGTIMRADTLRRYAAEAGFCNVEILPIDNYFFRFYRLRPICDYSEKAAAAVS